MGCTKSKNQNLNDYNCKINSNAESLLKHQVLPEDSIVLGTLIIDKNKVINPNDLPEQEKSNQIFNLKNINRWRGIDNIQFNRSKSGNGNIKESITPIKHCIKDIEINALKYYNNEICVSVKIPKELYNSLEIDIKSLSNYNLPILYCSSEHDLIECLNCLKKHVPEISTIYDVLINKKKIFSI